MRITITIVTVIVIIAIPIINMHHFIITAMPGLIMTEVLTEEVRSRQM